MRGLFHYHGNLKNVECSDNILRDVAHYATQYLPNELGPRFDLERFEIDNCDDHSGNKVEHRYQLFYCWKRKVGKHATYENFLSNLCRCLPKNESFIQDVCKLILNEHNLPLDCLFVDSEIESTSVHTCSPSSDSAITSAASAKIALKREASFSLLPVTDHNYLLKKQYKELRRVRRKYKSERKRRKVLENLMEVYLQQLQKMAHQSTLSHSVNTQNEMVMDTGAIQ